MDQIIDHLKASKHVLLTTHIAPDGDAIGSLLALGLCLERANKRITLYNESRIPAIYRFLPGVERISNHIHAIEQYDTAVVLDCTDVKRVGEAAFVVGRIPVLINIDHHATNSFFGDYQWVDPQACATAEIIHRLLKKMGFFIDPAVATALYTAILTDTGSFRFSNTNPAAFSICHQMILAGVSPHDVASNVYGRYSLARIKLLNLALDSIEICPGGKLSVMTLTRQMFQETGTRPEDVDGLVNYAKRIEDVRVAVLIQECDRKNGYSRTAKRFHVSLRSDGSVDVSAIASAFGGGGHETAAGFTVRANINEIKAGILDYIQQCAPEICSSN